MLAGAACTPDFVETPSRCLDQRAFTFDFADRISPIEREADDTAVSLTTNAHQTLTVPPQKDANNCSAPCANSQDGQERSVSALPVTRVTWEVAGSKPRSGGRSAHAQRRKIVRSAPRHLRLVSPRAKVSVVSAATLDSTSMVSALVDFIVIFYIEKSIAMDGMIPV